MSCPPAAFLRLEFLQHARQVLEGKGMLVVNCVSWAAEAYKAAVKALQVGWLYTHFRCLYCSSISASIMSVHCTVLLITVCSTRLSYNPCKQCICSNAYADVSRPQDYYQHQLQTWDAAKAWLSVSYIKCIFDSSADCKTATRSCSKPHFVCMAVVCFRTKYGCC